MNKNLLALSLAAAAAASTASAAVSSNIVGYVKLPIKKGYNLVSNPLLNTAAGGNKISNIFGAIDCDVLSWDGTKFKTSSILAGSGVVSGDDFSLAPGTAVFVFNANGDTTVTVVGDAVTGTQNNPIGANNNFVASIIPIGGKVTTDLGLTPTDGTTLATWNGSGYVTIDWLGGPTDGSWVEGEPSLAVGQGAVVNALTPFTWTKTFVVQ